jgi:hypothetical protein
MPTKRRRRSQGRRDALPELVLRLLVTGDLRAEEPHDELTLRRLSRDVTKLRRLFEEHRHEILAAADGRPWVATRLEED